MSNDAKNGCGLVTCIVYGVMASILSGLALLSVVSTLLVLENVGENNVDKFLPIIWIISGMIGISGAKRTNRRENIWLPTFTMAGYIVALLSYGMLMYDDVLRRPWLPMMCITAGGILSCALCNKGKKKRKRYNAAR